MLLAKVSPFSGEAKAKALSEPLAGTSFYNQGSIREVIDTVTRLVGIQTARTLLPKPYGDWLGVPAVPAKGG